jgi:hypothetical protein
VEWIILDYNSKDDLQDLLLENSLQREDRVVCLREISGRSWHASVAKNIAHRAAGGDVLMNLDCDNLIADAIDVLHEVFSGPVGALQMFTGDYDDGTYGRIAVRKCLFEAAGGYDESFHPMAYQDRDLLNRLRALGVTVQKRPCPRNIAIPNSKETSVQHCSSQGLTWKDFFSENRKKSRDNCAAGRLVANEGIYWGSGQFQAVG